MSYLTWDYFAERVHGIRPQVTLQCNEVSLYNLQ